APAGGGDIAGEEEAGPGRKLKAKICANGKGHGGHTAQKARDHAQRTPPRVPEIDHADQDRARRCDADRSRDIADIKLDRVDHDLQLVPEDKRIVEMASIERIDKPDSQLPLDDEQDAEN